MIRDPYATLEQSRSFYRDKYAKSGPKMTVARQCEVYACLYRGVPPAIVRRAFSLSRTTVSYIGGCRDDDRKPVEIVFDDGVELHSESVGGAAISVRSPERKPRYQYIVDQWERLGEAEFLRAYYTEETSRRIAAAAYEFNTDKKTRRFYFGD